MTHLLLSIYCALAFVAFSESRQVNPGPQYFKTPSLPTSQKLDNRIATQVITLYLTPTEMKSLREAQGSSMAEIQSFEQMEMEQKRIQAEIDGKQNQEQSIGNNQYEKVPEQIEEPKAELRGLLSHDSFYPKESQILKEQQKNYNFINLFANQRNNEDQKQISNPNSLKNAQLEITQNQEDRNINTNVQSVAEEESEWKPFIPKSTNQEQAQLQQQIHEQLQQHWNRILNHNRVQLNRLSTIQKDNAQKGQDSESTQVETTPEQAEPNNKKKDKSELEKQIEKILKENKSFEDIKREIEQSGPTNQTPPILIHKEVSVTRHLPLHVVKHVKVPVPTPVLVPVPEPYEVKVPHPYPVPLEVVKHIPVPVVKRYQ